MKLLASFLVAVLFFAGCTNDGIAVNTLSNNKVDRYFINGYIQKQKKVIINDKEVAILGGAVAGGAVGAVTTHNRGKGADIGAVLGGITGAIIGKEIEAYETTIKAENGKEYKGYLKQRLLKNTRVEFTVKNNKLKNVNVLSYPKRKISTLTSASREKISSVRKQQQKHFTVAKQIIKKRVKRGSEWYYTLADKTTVKDSKYYPYKDDLVKVVYDDNLNVVDMIRLKCLSCKPKAKRTVKRERTTVKQAQQKKQVVDTNQTKKSFW